MKEGGDNKGIQGSTFDIKGAGQQGLERPAKPGNSPKAVKKSRS